MEPPNGTRDTTTIIIMVAGAVRFIYPSEVLATSFYSPSFNGV